MTEKERIMKRYIFKAVFGKAAFALMTSIMLAACASPEHRLNVAASKDDARRSQFEQCRNQGRTDCDAILNAPVNGTPPPNDVREQERREAYDRCIARNGTDCDDLLRR
jgi:hypothetical protein